MSGEHIYDRTERAGQLDRLERALVEIVRLLPSTPEYAAWLPDYESAQSRLQSLRQGSFTDEDLKQLAESIPAILWLHKEWVPPLRQISPGVFDTPEWFDELERCHTELMKAAFDLRSIGYY